MVSPNKAYKFCFQTDGNIVMYNEANKPTWSSNSAGASKGMANALSMSIHGRLVAWNGTEARLDSYWESPIPSNDREGPFDGILQNDGNFVIIRRSDKKVLWSTSPVPPSVCPKDCQPSPGHEFKNRLFSHGEDDIENRLLPGECLVSDNGKHSFCFESDGNVVVYSQEKPVWKSNSTAQQPTELFMDHEDGQLVAKYVDASNSELGGGDFWYNIPNKQTIQSGAPFTAIMNDDGNFVIKRGDEAVIWSTNTTQPDEPVPSTPPSPQPSPPPSPQPQPPPPKGMSTGMIVGIVAGVVLGLAALGAGIFFLMKHRRSSRAQSSSQPSGHKAVGQVAPVKADVEMGGADQMGGTPGKVALAK